MIKVEKKREEASAERYAKLQKIMDKMADVVVGDKDQRLQKKADRDYIASCLAKDKQAELEDFNKKQESLKEHFSVQRVLDQQILFRKLKEDNEKMANKYFENVS